MVDSKTEHYATVCAEHDAHLGGAREAVGFAMSELKRGACLWSLTTCRRALAISDSGCIEGFG
jgi:hypothetical protein